MNVKDLIIKLQQLPDDAEIFVGYETTDDCYDSEGEFTMLEKTDVFSIHQFEANNWFYLGFKEDAS